MQTLLIAAVLLGGDNADVVKSVRNAIRIMTAEGSDWQTRCNAEDELKKHSSKVAIELLLPHIAKGIPPGGIWNSAGRDHDKRAPIKWQIYYAVHRSWDFQLSKLQKKQRADLLLELLPKAKTAYGRRRILDKMAINWAPKAEPVLAAMLRDEKLDFGSRRDAGFVLMLHQGRKYHETLFKLATKGPRTERKQWFDILVDPRHKRRVGTDVRVTELGFKLLVDDKAANPKYIHGAYFIACKLETYLGQTFRPDQRKKEYRANNGGLTELFFKDTVENALQWWAMNKKK